MPDLNIPDAEDHLLWNAYKLPEICIQPEIDSEIASESCLFINIFSFGLKNLIDWDKILFQSTWNMCVINHF